MAKAVTLKNTNNEEVYPVTDATLVHDGIYADEPGVPSDVTADVTNDRIDWASIGSTSTSTYGEIVINTSDTEVAALSLSAGTWLLIATSDFNHNNTYTGNCYVGFRNKTAGNTVIGANYYFDLNTDGTYNLIVTCTETAVLSSAATVTFVAAKSAGTLNANRRHFAAIRIG